MPSDRLFIQPYPDRPQPDPRRRQGIHGPDAQPTAAAATPVLMRRLRAHTATVHAATEALPLMRRVLTDHPSPAGYRGYLAAFHALYLAVEPALYAATPAQLLTELGIAPKLPALQQDLRALAATAGGAPPLPPPGSCQAVRALLDLPDTTRGAAALGGLYVLEGATLGGQVIARHLRAHWPAGVTLPTAFLEFRLHHPGGGWRGFGVALARWTARHPGSERAILDGALGVFSMMHEALAAAELGATEAGPNRIADAPIKGPRRPVASTPGWP